MGNQIEILSGHPATHRVARGSRSLPFTRHVKVQPVTLADATATWATKMLREAGILTGGVVTQLKCHPLGSGVGVLGQVGRLEFFYSPHRTAGPRSAVLKLPSIERSNFARAMTYRLYEREILFYKRLAPSVPLRVPKCYWSSLDKRTNRFALLLEDLYPMIPADQIAGLSPARARSVMDQIARLHRQWWASPRLNALAWIPSLNSAISKRASTIYAEAWPIFAKKYSGILPQEALRLGERVGERYTALLDALASPPVTLVHGDFRLDNLFFGKGRGSGSQLAVIDWQMIMRGRAMYDVAVLLTQSLQIATRRKYENELLQRWQRALGPVAPAFSAAQMRIDYQRATLLSFIFPVAASTIDLGSARGNALMFELASRVFTAATDIEAEVVLSAR